MRPFEILLLILLVSSAAAIVVGVRPRRRTCLIGLGLTLALALLHFGVEGARAQMTLALVLLGLWLVLLLFRPGERSERAARPTGLLRRLSGGTLRYIAVPVLTLVAALIPAAIVVPYLPEPTGEYAVGVTDFMLRFEDRPEILTSDPGDVRELVVRAWYPALPEEGSRGQQYLTEAEGRAFAESLGSMTPGGGLLYSHAPLAKTHSHRDAPIATEAPPFPVLAYSHGYTSFSAQNTPLMEELASHGYVVFSIAHTHDSSSVFPDGRVVQFGEHVTKWSEALLEDPEAQEALFAVMERFIASPEESERRAALNEQIEQARRDAADRVGVGLSWDVWVEDRLAFFDVLEELQSGKRPSLFEGRLDLTRIGTLGMSFGGATAAEVCHLDERCVAAVNIDGGHMYGTESTLLDGDIRTPMLMIHSEDLVTHPSPTASNADDYNAYTDFHYEPYDLRGTRPDVVRLKVNGTAHLHLTDMSLMVRWIPGIASSTPGDRVAEILNRYITEFFDHQLRDGDVELLAGPTAEFPEVKFQTFGRSTAERTRTVREDPVAATDQPPASDAAEE